MKRTNSSRLFATASRAALGGVVMVCLSHGAAQAADAGQPQAAVPQVAEVIVTARRRAENLQRVPIAATVLNQGALKNNNIQTLEGLQFQVPSLSESAGLTRDAVNVSIRGQGSNSISDLPGVIAYLNEVPLPTDKDGSLAGGPGLLFDLQNVQVLKGPQGTLFGRNAVGGAVLLQTARPQNEYSGEIEATYGNYNDRELNGYVNLPIVDDKLLARIAFSGQERDGFTYVQGEPAHPDGFWADNRDFGAVRGTLTFKPTSGIENNTIISYSQFKSTPSPAFISAINTPIFDALAPSLVPIIDGMIAQQNALGPRNHIPIDNNMVSNGDNIAIDNLTDIQLAPGLKFRNIIGYDQSTTVYQVDIDGTVLPIGDLPDPARFQTINQFTEEAQLQGSALSGKLDWVGGLFYLDQPPTSKYLTQDGLVLGLPFDGIFRQGDQSEAIFAQGNYDLSSVVSGLKFTGGLRYSGDQQILSGGGGGIGSVCGATPVNCTPVTTKSSSSAPTWTAGLSDQLDHNTMVYLTVSRGYRAGGANVAETALTFGPEYVTEYETGVKSDWKIGQVRLRTDADAYYQDYTDIQVQTFTIATGSVTSNAATAHQWGVEFEGTAQLTDDLQIGVNFDHLEFEYTEFGPNVAVAQIAAGAEDNRPRWKYGVNLQYHLPTPQAVGEFNFRTNWNWQAVSGQFLSQGTGLIPAFGLLNFSLDWNRVMQSHASLSFFMSNALNTTYQIGSGSFYESFGLNTVRYGEPRMFGVRLKYDFGPHG